MNNSRTHFNSCECFLASCIYYTGRRNQAPLLLSTVADALDLSPFELTRQYLRVAELLRCDAQRGQGPQASAATLDGSVPDVFHPVDPIWVGYDMLGCLRARCS